MSLLICVLLLISLGLFQDDDMSLVKIMILALAFASVITCMIATLLLYRVSVGVKHVHSCPHNWMYAMLDI